MTANTVDPNPNLNPSRPAILMMAVCAFAGGLMLAGEGSQAGHHQKAQGTIDPCVKLKESMTHRIEDIKKLNKELDAEKSAPNTLAGVFQMMEGKTYVDHEKTDKLTLARHEANDLNMLLHGMNCQTVDIDKELTKPAIMTEKKQNKPPPLVVK